MKQFGKGCHLQLIDGSGYIFRAYHMSERSLRTHSRYRSDGTPIGAINFFSSMLLRLVQDRSGSNPPTHAAVVFDHSGPTFRNQIYDQYKATRPPTPKDLQAQFPLSRDAARAFNFACLELEGFEADDIIATLAYQAQERGGEVTIVSSDKDLMQLVGDRVRMFEPVKTVFVGIEEVRAKFFVDPERVVDVQSLAGDATDNVPGAPGIGIKIAAGLINEYGDLDTLLDRADEIKQPKRRQALIEHADNIRLSRQLVTLAKDVPIENSLESLAVAKPDAQNLFRFLQAQEFRTIVERTAAYLGVEAPEPVSIETTSDNVTDVPFNRQSYECVGDVDHLRNWIEMAREEGHVAIHMETDNVDAMQAHLIGISLAIEPGQACYIPFELQPDVTMDLESNSNNSHQIKFDVAFEALKSLLEDESILKVGHDIKIAVKTLDLHGIRIFPFDDTMLMSYAMHAGLHRHSMDALSFRYLNHRSKPIKDLLGSGKNRISFDQVPIATATAFAGECADIILRLWLRLRPRLHQVQVTTVYETLERPLIGVLAEMELQGIRVDGKKLKQLSEGFKERINALQVRIFETAGQEFNISSPKQLGDILFDKFKFHGGKRLRKGGYGTSAHILETLVAEGHELPSLVLDFRKLAKLKSTYTDALSDRINERTGRVHTSFVISGANTGRLASTEPNLQNIPVRTEEGRRIREAFVADVGNVLLSLDYSQIELRVLAHVAGIEPLKEAFRNGQDIHAMTASEVFGVPIEGMSPMIRRQAKAINFGVIYGISSFGLARDLQIPRQQAKKFIQRYFERFPGIRHYMDATIEEARQNGYVKTLFGRKIHTPDISEKPPRRGAAERAAFNAPIQGTAADIIRRAMRRIPPAIQKLPAKMLIQVHDELLFEVREDAVEDVIRIVSKIMVNADRPANQLVPSLAVDFGFAHNWAEAH